MTRPSMLFGAAATILLSTLTLAGCGKNLEKELTGTWTSGQQSLELKADKKFELKQGMFAMAGTWSAKEKNVRLTTETIGGKPKDEFVEDLLKQMGGSGVSKAKLDEARKKAKTQLEGTDMAISEDMKSLTLTAPGTNQSFTFTKNAAK